MIAALAPSFPLAASARASPAPNQDISGPGTAAPLVQFFRKRGLR